MLFSSAFMMTCALGFVTTLQFIPERVKVTYTNEKYIRWGSASVRRFGRKSAYYFNIEGNIKHEWTNNVTFHFIFCEYLHNEYRRSFVELHKKLCDLLTSDPYIGGMLLSMGITCPMPAGDYHLMNITMPLSKFPNMFPFEKTRVWIYFNTTATGEGMASGYIDGVFKNDPHANEPHKNQLRKQEGNENEKYKNETPKPKNILKV